MKRRLLFIALLVAVSACASQVTGPDVERTPRSTQEKIGRAGGQPAPEDSSETQPIKRSEQKRAD